MITLASSKTVVHTAQLLEQGLGASWREVLEGVAIASIGPKTSETCRELLGRVDIEPAEYTIDALTDAIAGRWAGTAKASDGEAYAIALTLRPGCQVGESCGTISQRINITSDHFVLKNK